MKILWAVITAERHSGLCFPGAERWALSRRSFCERLHSAEGHFRGYGAMRTLFPLLSGVCFVFHRSIFAFKINSEPGKCQHEHIDCHGWTQSHWVRTGNRWIELSEARVVTFVVRSVIAGAFIDTYISQWSLQRCGEALKWVECECLMKTEAGLEQNYSVQHFLRQAYLTRGLSGLSVTFHEWISLCSRHVWNKMQCSLKFMYNAMTF